MNGDRHVIDEELRALLDDPVRLFVRNRDAMKEAFSWQGKITHCLAALLCADSASLIDTQRIKDMRLLVRQRTGLLSPFRGLPILPLATLLSGSLMPEDDLDRVLRLYETLRTAGFTVSPYLAESAFLPLLLQESFDAEACARAAHDMYRLQRKARPFLDAQTVCVYGMLCAAEGVTPEQGHTESELGYELLKTAFPKSGTTYALARVLTLGEGTTEDKCTRVMALYQALRARNIRYGVHYELPALGVLALLPAEIGAIADGIADMDGRLQLEKGFSAWSVPSSQRILYAATLYALRLKNEAQDPSWLSQGLIQSVTGVLIAAQTAAFISASAAASAAAASSSGGN